MSRETRRTVMTAAGALALPLSATTTGTLIDGESGREADATDPPTESDEPRRNALAQLTPRRTLLAATRYETGVYVVESGSSDGENGSGDERTTTAPTAVVVAGQHGIEPSGWLTAMQLTGLTLEVGTLVVIPFANPPAIVEGVYQTDDGDMNRQFPPDESPTADAAAAIWDELERHSPDVVLDLHSSHGIYESGVDSGLGQAVFPTAAGRDTAASATDWVNAELVGPSAYGDEYEFVLGNEQGDADRPLLTHKVGYDLDVPGYLVEVTRAETTLTDRVTWQTAMAIALLAENGVVAADAR